MTMRHDEKKASCLYSVIAIAVVLLMFLYLFTGCKTVEPVPSVEYVKEYIDRYCTDTLLVYVSDSTTIEKNGDSTTVTKSKSRDTYRGKARIDTVKVTKYVKEPYRVEVEKKLSKYEEISLKVGMWLIPIFAILVVIAICRFVYKRK